MFDQIVSFQGTPYFLSRGADGVFGYRPVRKLRPANVRVPRLARPSALAVNGRVLPAPRQS